MKTEFLSASAAVVLAVAALFVWLSLRAYPEASVKQPLAELLLAAEERGWTYENLPLWATESLDTCWVASGWQIREREDAYALPADSPAAAMLRGLPFPDLAAVPGRWRIFEKHHTDLPVVFWHLLEGEVYQYGNQSIGKRLKRLILDPFKNGFDTRKEQWLVRVSG